MLRSVFLRSGRGKLTSFELDPRQLGFEAVPVSRLAGGSIQQNAELVEQILRGTQKGPERDIVVLNTAAALHVAEEGDLTETVKKAIESLESGAAYEKLTQLVKVYSTS